MMLKIVVHDISEESAAEMVKACTDMLRKLTSVNDGAKNYPTIELSTKKPNRPLLFEVKTPCLVVTSETLRRMIKINIWKAVRILSKTAKEIGVERNVKRMGKFVMSHPIVTLHLYSLIGVIPEYTVSDMVMYWIFPPSRAL